MINISSLDNSTLPFKAFGINATDLSSLVNSYAPNNNGDSSTNSSNSSSSSSTKTSSDPSKLLGNRTVDYADQTQIYNLAENITQINHMKNCLNPYLGGYVGLSPRNKMTERIANLFATLFYQTIYFENDDQMNKYVKSAAYNDRTVPKLCFGVTFTQLPEKEVGYSYSLRFSQANPAHEVFETSQPWRTHPFKKEWLDKYEKYAEYGFLVIQTFIDNIIIQEHLNNSDINITGYINSVKTPTYYKDDLPGQLQGRSNIFTLLAYLPTFLKLVHIIMHEKETRIKEGMKMMGISEGIFYGSWLCVYFVIFLFLSLINSMILKVFIFSFSDYFLIFIVHLLYTIALMFHALFITVFFSRSKTAVVGGMFILFIEYLFVQIVDKDSVSFNSKTAASLSPVIAVSLASELFLNFEATENGITMDTVSTLYNGYNVTTAILFFLLSSGIFIFLFIYLNLVFPNEFGRKKSPLFCFTCCRRRKIPKKKAYEFIFGSPVPAFDVIEMRNEEYFTKNTFEKANHALDQQKAEHKIVEIINLSKVFPNGKKAVDNLNLTIYDNQIFVLLGEFNFKLKLINYIKRCEWSRKNHNILNANWSYSSNFRNSGLLFL